MKNRLARTIDTVTRAASAVERRLGQAFEQSTARLTRRSDRSREPIEVVHAIVDAVGARALPSGRGEHRFPYNVVRVLVACAGAERRAALDALINGASTLETRIVDRLTSVGCQIEELDVTVTYVGRAKATWSAPDFHVAFDRADAPTRSTTEPRPLRVDVAVAHGAAESSTYSVSDRRINLGRCVEVLDSRKRPIRTNHIAFSDLDDAVAESVSRRHAHISTGIDGHRRLHDDGSVRGTYIVRDGETIVVPEGSRGVRLESGDEIRVGDARLVVTLRRN